MHRKAVEAVVFVVFHVHMSLLGVRFIVSYSYFIFVDLVEIVTHVETQRLTFILGSELDLIRLQDFYQYLQQSWSFPAVISLFYSAVVFKTQTDESLP